ncbi:MAG: hypothetical protein U9O87_10110 [Verrucomicrobiota bacterium]|nr:hypothetical protein [Verrucomicrobiota bacterium]
MLFSVAFFDCTENSLTEKTNQYAYEITDSIDIDSQIKNDSPYADYYHFNIFIVTSLLFSTSLLFAVTIVCNLQQDHSLREIIFYYSQMLFFVMCAFDERFSLHEQISDFIGISDIFILLFAAIIELCILSMVFIVKHKIRLGFYFITAAILFGIMILLDVFSPKNSFLFFSIKDILKIWAVLSLFMYAWHSCLGKIFKFKKLQNE